MPIISLKSGIKSRSLLVGNPSFVPSSYESIATVTATGGQTSLSFTSIPSTYVSLQIRGLYRDTDTFGFSRQLGITFNSDFGTGKYAYHGLQGDGSSVTALGSAAGFISQMFTVGSGTDSGMDASCFGTSIIDIHDYASTTKNKTMRCFAGAIDNVANTNRRMGLASGVWLNTSAVTSIQLNASNAFVAGSTFSLYGIKGA